VASIVGNNCRLAAWWASGLVGICLALSSAPCWAVEGAAAAGPIGGSDIRSAILPSPGFYGGVVGLYNNVTQFHDGTGHPAPALNAVGLTDNIAGAFFLYVLDFKLFDGRIGLAGFVAGGQDCGQLVSAVPRRCTETGLGDPYFELSWSRSFGQLRPPTVTGAFPIVQGLVLDFGIGALLPIGNYNQQLQEMNGAEHVGRFQVGPAGFYVFQTGQDRQFGTVVPPDGRRLEYMAVGGVINYDIAEYNALIRFKANTTVFSQNGVVAKLFVLTLAKKLF
jgi:hypothetical protein